MRKQFLFLGLFIALSAILISSFAFAELDQFQVFANPVRDRITAEQSAQFNVTIINNANYDDKFNIDVDYSQWNVESSPLYITKTRFGWDVGAGKSDSAAIFLKAASGTAYGTYKITLTITSQTTGVKQLKDVVVNIRPSGLPYGEFLPTITASVDLTNNGIFDPRSPATVFINLDNYVPIKMPNMTVEVRSKTINKNLIVDLDPLERKTDQFSVVFDPLEKPVQDIITVEVFDNKKESLKKVSKSYEIIAYSTFDKDERVTKEFLRQTTFVNFTNNGNVNRVETTQLQTTFIGRFFTSTTPDSKVIKENGKMYLLWELNLEPQQSTQIVMVESFRGIALIALIVIAALVLYFAFRSPLVVQKEAKMLQRGEGNISELKILVYIRNRTNKPIHQIKILDKVPHIADLQEEVIIGTLKPSKIFRDSKKGTLVEWEIPMLEGHEERIISYKIKSKLNILGFFNLPSVLVKFKKDNKNKSVKSNSIKAAMK